jgi:hypothetical protein
LKKNLNFTKAKPIDVQNFHADNILLATNCHQLGTIQSFDASTQTASATIDYPKTINVFDEVSGNTIQKVVTYPPLADCPVRFAFGSKGGFTEPVKKGDKCMILFNDRDMDLWFTGVVGKPVNSNRLHHFSDALILVGFNPKTLAIQNFDNTRPMIRDFSGQTIIGLSADGSRVNIENSAQNLGTILQSLISHIQALTIVGSSVSPASVALLAQDAANLEALLE